MAKFRLIVVAIIALGALTLQADAQGRHVIPSSTQANLPAAGTAGAIARVTNNVRGVWMDQGSQWFATNGRVVNVQEFGATGDGSTDDTVAINAAIAALASSSGPGDLGSVGGGCVYFPAGRYVITSPLLVGTHNIQTFTYCLEGAGGWASTLVWAGGNTSDMIRINRSDNGNLLGARIRGLGFYNRSTSGSGVTAIRAVAVNAIRIGDPLVATSGNNGLVIEECVFQYMSNGIIAEQATGVNQLTVRKNYFSLIYNQTNPVVAPTTDAIVTGRGNAIYLGVNTTPQGVYLYDNEVRVQNRFLDVQQSVVNLVVQGNIVVPGDGGFQRGLSIRLARFAGVVIQGNEFDFSTVGGVGGNLLDLGTTALGSSSLSGGIVSGNYMSGTSSAGQNFIVLTFADGVHISGNMFFSSAGAGITLTGANVANTYIGPNFWNTVTTRLSDGGATGTTNLDDTISSVSRFPTAIGVGTTPANLGTIRMPYAGDLRSRNSGNTSNVSLIYLDTNAGVTNTVMLGDTGQNDIFVQGSITLKTTAPSYGTSVAIDANLSNTFEVTATDGVAFTVANPSNARTGKLITISISNTSGGALGAVTWASLYKLSAWANPATANSRSITFRYNGANWLEISRTPNDVPN